MRYTITLLLAGWLTFVSSAGFAGFLFQGVASSFVGACDSLAGCDEAFDIDRAATSAYSGPLFQLALVSSPTTKLDIGQKADHSVDLSTWSAFCGGVPSNCKYSRLYGHIHSGLNDLVPAVFAAPFGPNCSAAGLTCACPFALNATTGLPEMSLTAPCEYTIAGDAAAAGITGGSSSDAAVLFTGRHIATNGCCGVFGIAHLWSGADTQGTDFMIQLQFSNTGSFLNCPTANVFCLAADLESNTTPSGPSLGSSPIDLLALTTWDHIANTVVGAVNGVQQFSGAPPFALNPGNHIHLGGGGDLSQPATGIFRGAYIKNTVPTGAQQSAALANVKAFYPGLSFP